MLRKASQALFANEQFTLEEMHNYRMAVTEREVINGCISQNNVKDHVSKPGVNAVNIHSFIYLFIQWNVKIIK